MGGPGTAVESPDGAGAARAAGEARLAQQAAVGDGAAFAALYDRYELAVFNVCARVLETPDEAAVATQRAFLDALDRWPDANDSDVDLDLGLLAAAHAACAGAAESERAEPKGEPDAATGEPAPERYVDPERAEQLASLQDDVRRANRRLSEPHRELLALRDLEGLAYAQIALATDQDRESVIESLARARVSFRDALRDSSLAKEATKAPECKRALALLAMRTDGQLDDRAEREWLNDHLDSCETCRASLDAMQEARIAYRAWLPLLPPPWLRIDTLAEAEERGAPDASEQAVHPWEPSPENGTVSAARGIGAIAAPPPAADLALGEATSPLAVAVATSRGARERNRQRRRKLGLAVVIPMVLLVGGAAAVLAAGGGSGGKKRLARTAASPAPVVPAKAATPVPQPSAQVRRRQATKRTRAGSSALGLRTTPTQPTTPQSTPRTTSDAAPVARTPRRTTPQQSQSIGGGNENRTPRQPAPSRPMPAPAGPPSTAPTGTVGSSGASSP